MPPLPTPPTIPAEEFNQRLEAARALTASLGADAILINAGASLRYFSGVSWGATERLVSMILPVDKPPVFICPAFEEGSMRAELVDGSAVLRIWEEDESPFALCATTFKELGISRLALDPQLSFGASAQLKKSAADIDLIDASPVIDACRGRKSAAEIAIMQHAKNITMEVHRRVAKILEPGMSTTDVRRYIEQAHRELGAPGYSFCIVLFGVATSYPHGIPGEQYLKEGDVVLIDTGCSINGYNSDITRTYVFGEPTAEQRRIWNLEKEAQQAAFDAATIGTPCEAVDQAARRVLEKAGLGPGYSLPGLPHRTGHGIGLSIHEGPYLVRGDKTPLAAGMCFSNEPMIVVPGKFGIRLEDHFYMTDTGPKWFTQPSRSIEEPV